MKKIRIVQVVFSFVFAAAVFTAYAQPSVYAHNAAGNVYQGECLGGAVLPGLECNDWMPLYGLLPDMGTYRVVVAGNPNQTTNLNLAALAVVDHPQNTDVLFDKNGNLHTLQLVERPRMAVDQAGRDVQRLLADTDSLVYYGGFDEPEPDAEEALVFEFKRLHGIMEAKVVIDAKTTTWFEESIQLRLTHSATPAENGKHLQQHRYPNMGVGIWLETAPGVWEHAGWFPFAGSRSMRRQVAMIDISALPSETVRIKLTYPFRFWEIDRVGMDFSTDLPVLHQPLKPLKVVDGKGSDLLQAVLADDPFYLVLAKPSDAATAVFDVPKEHPGLRRTVFLHVKGWWN